MKLPLSHFAPITTLVMAMTTLTFIRSSQRMVAQQGGERLTQTFTKAKHASSAMQRPANVAELKTPPGPPVDILPTYSDIIHINGSKDLYNVVNQFFLGTVCENHFKPSAKKDSVSSVASNQRNLLNVTFSCEEAFTNVSHGTGNIMSFLYGLRLDARVIGNTDILIHCTDAMEQRHSLITPWLTGFFPYSDSQEKIDLLPSRKEVCQGYRQVPLGYQSDEMVFEMRRLAVALVGIHPSPNHPSHAWAREYLWASNLGNESSTAPASLWRPFRHPQPGDGPLFPNVELDDAVLNFRCGDIVDSRHQGYGFLKFRAFSDVVSPIVRTIGVVTQPFDVKGQQRKSDASLDKLERCRKIIYAFMDHLEEKFPHAKVRLHNSVDETIALTFARMIMANQTVVSISTFGAFPVLSIFGQGYINKPDYPRSPNQWLGKPPIPELFPQLQLLNVKRMMAPQVSKKWGTNGTFVIDWLKG